jgi:hypothetical protein
MTDDGAVTERGVVDAIVRAIACVRAWLRVQDAKRGNRLPYRRTADDAARVIGALATALSMVDAAPPRERRYQARRYAAERLQKVFHRNQVAAEQGDAGSLQEIEAVCDEVSAAFGDWN